MTRYPVLMRKVAGECLEARSSGEEYAGTPLHTRALELSAAQARVDVTLAPLERMLRALDHRSEAIHEERRKIRFAQEEAKEPLRVQQMQLVADLKAWRARNPSVAGRG